MLVVSQKGKQLNSFFCLVTAAVNFNNDSKFTLAAKKHCLLCFQENLSKETQMLYDESSAAKQRLQSEVEKESRQLRELIRKTTALVRIICLQVSKYLFQIVTALAYH